MNWIGTWAGAFLGGRFGGLLGAVAGAVLGAWVEKKLRGAADSAGEDAAANKNEMLLLTALSAMLAKMAKADGVVTADEVRYCEDVFTQLGLQGEKRAYCVRVFQRAKNDARSIYDYARAFADAQSSAHVRACVYTILWDLACQDGQVHEVELGYLRELPRALRLDEWLFAREAKRHGLNVESSPPPQDDPYAVLGCTRADSNEALRAAYRKLAKQLHPDLLRARGLSEEFLAKANEQMARVNAAWAEVRRERGL